MYPYTTYHSQRLSDTNTSEILAAQANNTPENTSENEQPQHNNSNNNTSDDTMIKNMMNDAIKNKSEQSSYYAKLARTMQDQTDSDIIHNMHLDESKHKKMLTDMYSELFGTEPEFSPQEKQVSQNMIYEFEKSMYDELNSAEYLRKLYFYFLNLGIRDYLYEIMTDDTSHAIKLSHLYSKYNK